MPTMTGLDKKEAKQVMAVLQGGDAEEGFRVLLGPEQYERFEPLPMTLFQVNKLWDAYLVHQGLQPGESSASTAS